MTRPLLLLVHGWGFDARFWEPLRAALDGIDCLAWDLGFFGAPSRPPPPAGRPVVAVGHSFGLLWLLRRRPLSWCRLVSVNGFPRFSRAPDYPGMAPRPLERMRARLAEAPQAVHADFIARCGGTVPEGTPGAASLALPRLAWGLDALADWDAREALQSAGEGVTLVLAGKTDPLVPPEMTSAAFPGGAVHWHDGGHLLPQTAAPWCAGHLRALVESL